MSKALLSEMIRSLRHNLTRFISLIIIVALGAGFFAGVKATGPSMRETVKDYYNDNNFADLAVRSSLGLSQDDVAALANLSEAAGVMGQKFTDALLSVNGVPETDLDGSQISVRVYGINLPMLKEWYEDTKNPNFINRPTLLEGTYPTRENQCLVDRSKLSTPESFTIGTVISLQSDSSTDLSAMKYTQFEIVGIIETPNYISFERGNTMVGNGKLGCFIYVPDTVLQQDYYSEAYIRLRNSSNFAPYSDDYARYTEEAIKQVQSIADVRCEIRRGDLASAIPERIADAKAKYKNAKNLADSNLKQAKDKLDELKKYAEDPDAAYEEAVAKVAGALGLAENTFNGNKDQYNRAVEQYGQYLEQYKNMSQTLEEKQKALEAAQSAIDTIESAINGAETSKDTTQFLVDQTQSIIDSTDSVLTALEDYQNGKITDTQLLNAMEAMRSINPELYESIRSLSAVALATQAVALVTPYVQQQKEQLASYQDELDKQDKEIADFKSQLQEAKTLFEQRKTEAGEAKNKLDSAYNQLNSMNAQLTANHEKLTEAQIELMLNKNTAQYNLGNIKQQIQQAAQQYPTALADYEKAVETTENQLSEIQKQIDMAEKTLADLNALSWTVMTRSDFPGYSSYESAVNNIEVLANIFPVIFFIVAALICFTTMTRMVEEDRTQMGTLKALGYSGSAICAKYILYALFAALIGAAIGIVGGLFLFPSAITTAYSIMFDVPSVKFTFPLRYILIGMGLSVITILAAATLSCIAELRVKPAALMRPKAPKAGKRILLDRLGLIWTNMTFTSKVTARNIVRRKSKLLMTVLGIAGCTALILGSSGLYASIGNIMTKQYAGGSPISKYDVQIAFAHPQKDDSVMMQSIRQVNGIQSVMLTSVFSVNASGENSDKTDEVYLFVPEKTEDMPTYFDLRDRNSKKTLSLNDGGAVITEKFADKYDISPGENVKVRMSDGKEYTIPVSAVAENYTFNYIYITENMYQFLTQSFAEYSYAVCVLDKTVYNSAAQEAALASALMQQLDDVNAVALTEDTIVSLNHVINVISIIILIFIAAAGILAFLVMYNLSNINLSERARELATLKVLGFYEKEMNAYVNRESFIMTLLGILLGLAGGIVLHKLLIMYCSVDVVMFDPVLKWYCYIISAVITALFALLAGKLTNRHIRRVDMVESLKSIE